MTRFLEVNKMQNFKSWESIDWKIVNNTLTNLYLLIFDAKKKGNYENVNRWQEILFYSRANILFSINSVTDFCFTKNVYKLDKLLIKNNSQRWSLYLSLVQFKPKDWIILIKSNTNKKFNSIFSLKGLIIQNMLINIIKPELDSNFDLNLVKLRSFKNAISYFYLFYSCNINKNWIMTINLAFYPNSRSKRFSKNFFRESPLINIIEILIRKELKNFLKILDFNLGEISIKSFVEKKTIFPFLLDIILYDFEKNLILKLLAFNNSSIFRYNNRFFIFSNSRVNCEKIKFYISSFFNDKKEFEIEPLIKIENRAVLI